MLSGRMSTGEHLRFPRGAEAFAKYMALARKAVSFGLVGLVNTSIDFGVFWVAVQKFALPLILANVLSWSIAVSASYAMNSMFTFAAESGRKLRWRAYGTFVASGILGVVANTATLLAAIRLTPLVLAGEAEQLAAAKLCAIAVSFLVNFSLSHFVVFRVRPEPAGDPG
jgi:putative flippase GtrA